MNVMISDVEIRGYEQKISKEKNNPYLIVYFEDINSGKASNIICRNVTIMNKLKKGEICNLLCTLEIGKYTNFQLQDIVEVGV